MSLNQTLINNLRAAQDAHGAAHAEYMNTTEKFDLTPGSKAEYTARLLAGVGEKIAPLIESGVKAIDKKAEELTAAENADAKRRAADTGYQSRLSDKIATICALDFGTLEPETIAAIKESLQEFENDPIAIAAITGATKGQSALTMYGVLPKNTKGQAQKALQDVKKNYISCIERCMNADRAGGFDKGADVAVEGLCTYLAAQNEDFSLDAPEVWAKANGSDAGEKVGMFTFHFKGVR